MIDHAGARSRLADALGLGPVWVRRSRPAGGPLRPPREDDSDAADERLRSIAAMEWTTLQSVVRGCLACPLSDTRTHAVFGAGAERPSWLIVGGGPRASDDEEGLPFTGAAGRLLDAMLASVGLSRERDVFVTDVVKCRVPADRAPSPFETARCRPYLERQVAWLAPTLIVSVGDRAALALVGGDATVADLRGREHLIDFGGRAVPLVVTEDPSDLLDDGMRKARVWADLCLAGAIHRRVRSIVR